jgi:hypothetical protein
VTTRAGMFGGLSILLNVQTEEYTIESGFTSGVGFYVSELRVNVCNKTCGT